MPQFEALPRFPRNRHFLERARYVAVRARLAIRHGLDSSVDLTAHWAGVTQEILERMSLLTAWSYLGLGALLALLWLLWYLNADRILDTTHFGIAALILEGSVALVLFGLSEWVGPVSHNFTPCRPRP